MSTQPDQAARWHLLLDALAERSALSVAEAADLLGVSAATVRRDFGELARRQLASRTHGGIVATSVAYNLPAKYRTSTDDPRERIAIAASARIAPGSIVAFNGGTTTTAIARRFAARTDLAEASELTTVVTNALNIASDLVLRPSVRTVVIGGVARPQSYELHGPFASRVLKDLLVEDLFLGVDALGPDGASCRHLGEAGINSEMTEHAQRVTVVATAEKMGRVSLARICGLDRVDALITDTTAPTDLVEGLREAGVDVTTV